MVSEKKTICTDSGKIVEATAPVIISASRSTDIPAFYAKWFFNRLAKGYCAWYNPFNQQKMYISFSKCKVIVFWTKNPKPIIPYLHILYEMGIHYYFQVTLNDYTKEGFEPNVPSVDERIETFKQLSDMVGKEKVAVRQIRKKLNENENNITELFFANRMATFFPELKELIHQEKEQYEEFRAVTFSKKFILPKVNSYIESEKNTSKISKFGKTLSELYQNAGLSVKSIITIVILNGISEENEIKLKQYLSDELKKAWEAAKKYKGKKVKPEKPKKKNSLLSKALAAQQ